MAKKVRIIGAGVAGLSAGCYLQMNGYDTEIHEMHSLAGGLCTAWKRKGYTIDFCIHWLVGSSPADPFYRLWNELIDLNQVRFVNPEEYLRVEDRRGNRIRVFADIDRLEKELLEKAPEDKKVILPFTRAVRKFTHLSMPVNKALELMNLADGLKMALRYLPYLPGLRKWSRLSAADVAARCRNPLLRRTFLNLFLPEMSAFFLVLTMAWMNKKSGGYPLGGSLPFVHRIEERYLSLGGKIHFNSKVTSILVRKGQAKGITLENGETLPAHAVISAADGHQTIFEMLEGKYLDDRVRAMYDTWDTFPPLVQVALGANCTFVGEPHQLVFVPAQPLVINDQTRADELPCRIFNFDPSLAPPGKTVLTVTLFAGDSRYWTELRQTNRPRYEAEKKRIADEVIAALNQRWPKFASQVEMTDVATPASLIRYTGNWRGSFEGWVLNAKNIFKPPKKTLPGLKNFYMAGQWVEPGGGLPVGLLSGRNVTQLICHADGKPFKVIPAAPEQKKFVGK